VAAFVVALGPGDDSEGGRRRGLLETNALVRVVVRILTSHAVAGETALRSLVVCSPPSLFSSVRQTRPGSCTPPTRMI
jgi:hypothetical protein